MSQGCNMNTPKFCRVGVSRRVSTTADLGFVGCGLKAAAGHGGSRHDLYLINYSLQPARLSRLHKYDLPQFTLEPESILALKASETLRTSGRLF